MTKKEYGPLSILAEIAYSKLIDEFNPISGILDWEREYSSEGAALWMSAWSTRHEDAEFSYAP